MLNIDKLLKKKRWTGKEVGRLEFVNTMDLFRQSLEGVQNPKQIISHADLAKMTASLIDPVQKKDYYLYRYIIEWFAKEYGTLLYMEKCLEKKIMYFANFFSTAFTEEDIFTYIQWLPAIFTEKQYADIVASRKKELLHPEDEEIGFNVFNMVEEALNYYVNLLQTEPRKKNPLKPLKEKLEHELVTDPLILSQYNSVYGYGYYQLPDGTRSDKVTNEEWLELVQEDLKRIEREEAIDDFRRPSVISAIAKAEPHYYSKGDAEEELFTNKYVWHVSEEPPTDLTKWEILQGHCLGEFYSTLYGANQTDEEAIADIEAFKKEFSSVLDALFKDMERYISDIRALTSEEWLNRVYSWEELYKADYYGFRKSYIDSDEAIFDGNYRAVFNGIAILRPSSLLKDSPLIDPKTGYFKAPKVETTLADLGLRGFFEESEQYARNLEVMEETKKGILSDFYYLQGYNHTLDLIAQYYDVEEIAVGKTKLEDFRAKIEGLNKTRTLLKNQIERTVYEDESLKKRKLEVLEDIITPIPLEGLEIPQEVEERVAEDIRTGRAFTNDYANPRLTMFSRDDLDYNDDLV